MNRLFTYFVVGSMILGVLVGWVINVSVPADSAKEIASNLTIITDVFLRLIKMIIAPLVFATLVAGIAHMEDAGAVGRIGVKTMGWFIGASIISLTIGLIMVHILQPGSGLNLTLPDAATTGAAVDTAKFTLRDFITHLVPKSIVEAMANNEILQIVVFSVFVGTAVAAIDDKAPAVLALVEQVAAIMLKVTGYVMKTAPLAIFAALAAIAVVGERILWWTLHSKHRAPKVLAHAHEVADLLDIEVTPDNKQVFAEVFSGNRLLAGMEPFAMCYGGHQFGHWAGQLGDGRAINLGEVVNGRGEHWTLQLKGAGPTP